MSIEILAIIGIGILILTGIDVWLSLKNTRELRCHAVRMDQLEQRLDVHADWIGNKASVSELELHVARHLKDCHAGYHFTHESGKPPSPEVWDHIRQNLKNKEDKS